MSFTHKITVYFVGQLKWAKIILAPFYFTKIGDYSRCLIVKWWTSYKILFYSVKIILALKTL
jgi:hypothetical protein